MNGLLIIGAGGHGKVIVDTALVLGWTNLAFLDDRADALGSVLGVPVVGKLINLAEFAPAYRHAVVALGEAKRRLAMTQRCRETGLGLVSLIHPTAYVSRFASVGTGCAVLAQSAISAGARIGVACIVNTGATVDHDCAIGDGAHVCPGAHLGGNVRVGDRSWIGIAASVRQGITIGSDVTVGAGAVVIGDVTDGATVIGVPAKERHRSP
ncbi:MAG TPA: acetyltransferase [Steroidobacteraceae bacterium]|nr:acetyltransferase [Steroidobacteraceae bacterium]